MIGKNDSQMFTPVGKFDLAHGPSFRQWKDIYASRKRGQNLEPWEKKTIWAVGDPHEWVAHWFKVSQRRVRVIRETKYADL